MASKLQSADYRGVRITVHSTQPFDTIINKLYAEIGSPKQISVWNEMRSIRDQDAFIEAIKKATGTAPGQDVTDRFMIFQARPSVLAEFNHGAWVPLFGVGGGRKCKRILLGNPLVAITMLKHDMKAGLSVPVELLVVEATREEGGGVDLVYHLPSALIVAGGDNPELEAAAQKLDEKFQKLVLRIA